MSNAAGRPPTIIYCTGIHGKCKLKQKLYDKTVYVGVNEGERTGKNGLKKSMAILLCALLMAGIAPATALATGIQTNVLALTVNDTSATIVFAGHEWHMISTGSGAAALKSGT